MALTLRQSLCLNLATCFFVTITCHGQALSTGQFPSSIAALTAKAEAGDVEAQHQLAALYKHQQNYNEAAVWYEKAAQQGNADSQYNLAIVYDYGYGRHRSSKDAAFWYRKAAEQGVEAAQFALAMCLEYGKGVKRDESAAANWYEKAAIQGDGVSMGSLGAMYETGRGVPKDNIIAYKWFLLSEKFDSFALPPSPRVPNLRHNLMNSMTDAEVAEGEKLAASWIAQHPQLARLMKKDQ